MRASESLFVRVDTWRHPAPRAGESLASIDHASSPIWHPDFRFWGGVLRWAIQAAPDTTAVVAIFASQAGMQEAEAGTMDTGSHPDFDDRAMKRISHVSGPLTDMFSRGHNQNSSLRVLEKLDHSQSGDQADGKFMSVVRWRFRTDGDPLPNGTLLGEIPEKERFGRYQDAMLAQIVPRLNRYSLIGGWMADIGNNSMASIGMYARETGMADNWADIQTPGSEGANLYRHLELIDRVAGPVTDLLQLRAEEPPGND